MLNKRLLEILQDIGPADLKKLRLFIQSPYYTYGIGSQDVIKIFDLIVKHGAREEHPALQKHRVSALIFPDKPYVEKGKNPVDTLTSNLLGLVRKFLFVQSMEQQSTEAMQELEVARFYRRAGLEERFWQSIEKIRSLVEADPVRDERYYLDRYNIEREVTLFKGLYNSMQDDANIESALKYLDRFYAVTRLSIAGAHNNQRRQVMIGEEPGQLLVNSLRSLAQSGYFSDEPMIIIYDRIMEMQETGVTQDMLAELAHLVDMHKGRLNAVDKFTFYTYLRIFHVAVYASAGKSESLRRLYDLMIDHLGQGVLYFEDKLIFTALRNLVAHGLRLGEFEQVRRILDTHGPERIGGTRYPEEVYNLMEAQYSLAQKAYDQAHDKLIYRNFDNIHLSIQADILLIKMYYETGSELLEYRMKACQQKVRRSSLAQENKQRYHNFFSILDKIVRYGHDRKHPRWLKIHAEIQEMNSLIEREWLLEQLV
jgi:hypothetical protein